MTSLPKRVVHLPSPRRVAKKTSLSDRIRRAVIEEWDYVPGSWADEVEVLETFHDRLAETVKAITDEIGFEEQDLKGWEKEPIGSPTVQRGITYREGRILAYRKCLDLLKLPKQKERAA